MCTRKEKEKGKGKEKKIRKGFVSIDKQHLLNRHSTSFRSFVTSRVRQSRRKLPLFAPPTTPPSPLSLPLPFLLFPPFSFNDE